MHHLNILWNSLKIVIISDSVLPKINLFLPLLYAPGGLLVCQLQEVERTISEHGQSLLSSGMQWLFTYHRRFSTVGISGER